MDLSQGKSHKFQSCFQMYLTEQYWRFSFKVTNKNNSHYWTRLLTTYKIKIPQLRTLLAHWIAQSHKEIGNMSFWNPKFSIVDEKGQYCHNMYIQKLGTTHVRHQQRYHGSPYEIFEKRISQNVILEYYKRLYQPGQFINIRIMIRP